MRSAEPGRIAVIADPAELPGWTDHAVAPEGDIGLFASRAWYRTVVDHGLPAGAMPCFLSWIEAERSRAIFPMVRLSTGGLEGLTTPYTCAYAPLLGPGIDAAAMARAGAALGRFCLGWSHVRLDAIPLEWPGLEPLLSGLRRSGLVVRRFDHFGNWFEPVAGLTWPDYLSGRPGALRETVRRKLRRSARDPRVRFQLIADDAAVAEGIDAFESVYRRSWKEPEPFPSFNAALIARLAAAGLLRLGVLSLDGAPVAAQVWTVEGGRATVLKLAHDEAFGAISPGTVLTARMLEHLLDGEHTCEIDFGRGDDPYKRLWASRRRQRIGLLLINPRRPRGLAILGRHVLGSGRRAATGILRRPAPL